MIPNDQISSAGFQIKYFLNGDKQFKTGHFDGTWTSPGVEKTIELNNLKNESISLVQTGPNLNSLPALNTTTPTVQTKGFDASLKLNQKEVFKKEKAAGWITVSDSKWGIGLGIRNFLKSTLRKLPSKGIVISYMLIYGLQV